MELLQLLSEALAKMDKFKIRTTKTKAEAALDSTWPGRITRYNQNWCVEQLSAINAQRGVSVIAKQRSSGRVDVSLKMRTHGAGYRKLNGWIIHPQSIQSNQIDQTIQDIARAAVTALSVIPGKEPDAWQFSSDRFVATLPDGTIELQNNCVIARTNVIKIVAVASDRSVSDVNIHQPGIRCWYLLDCTGHAGATFNIISDGDVLFPVNRITPGTQKVRITYGSGKATANLARMNIIDKELVNTAISAWVNKI